MLLSLKQAEAEEEEADILHPHPLHRHVTYKALDVTIHVGEYLAIWHQMNFHIIFQAADA